MFDQAKAERITERLSAGEPMAQICKDQQIGYRTIFRWMDENPTFSAAIARARDIGADAIADEAFEIADTGNMDDTQRARLRVETRLKLLAKWNPKRYGDRVQVDADLRVQITVNDPFAPLPAQAAQATMLGTPAAAADAAEAPGTPPQRVSQSEGTGCHLLPAPESKVPVISQNIPAAIEGTGNTPTDVPRGARISARTGKPVRKYTRSPV